MFFREEVAKELKSALSHIKLSSEGVYVQASTLGSLEALLEFLRTSKIPVSTNFIYLVVYFVPWLIVVYAKRFDFIFTKKRV